MDNSIAYYFVNKGYDVWFGNNRGNKYSCKHEKYSTKDPEYWDFSFQEMADYDVPTFIDFVKEKTGNDKITVLGHSQGAIQMFAALSENTKLQDSISNQHFYFLIYILIYILIFFFI